MNNRLRVLAGLVFALIVLCVGTSLGSSNISLFDTVRIIFARTFDLPLNANIDPKNDAIVWSLRLPRVLLAFLAGGSVAIAGAVFQSILKNQLASPYILGVSSGASLGAGLVIAVGLTIPFIGGFTLPLAGFIFGLVTVFGVVALSSKFDKSLSNNTVILMGMVISLFVNAILTTMHALFREELRSLYVWQMGSFALRGWPYVRMILPFFIIGTLGVIRYTKEMDILTFGEEQAQTIGVETRSLKTKLFFFAAVLTGGAVALSGTIGFVDLIAPHVARRIVGSNHRYVIPMSFITGGSLMVITDLIARTIISPSELPVGAVTALIGAPFFAWVYFRKR